MPGTVGLANTSPEGSPSGFEADQCQQCSNLDLAAKPTQDKNPTFSKSGGQMWAHTPKGRPRGESPSSLLFKDSERDPSQTDMGLHPPPPGGWNLMKPDAKRKMHPFQAKKGSLRTCGFSRCHCPGQGRSRPPQGPSSRKRGKGRHSCARGYLSAAEGLP